MTAGESYQRRFEVLREIASGGFGTVFLCRQVQTDGFSRVVAVKLLHPQWSENEEVSKRMRDEARLLGLLRHRNIVDVFDLTRLDGRIAVVMEYLEAIDLKAICKGGLPLPGAAVLQLGAQVASALDAAYNKAPVEGEHPLRALHRDIKPSNIMVDAEGTAKVLDFGVARGDYAGREAQTQGMAFGSFEYMPSERRFMESGGETSDVYSLGAVLFELLMGGEKLGKGKLKPKEHAAFVKARMDALYGELLERLSRPDDSVINPRSVEELVDFLASMLAFDEEDRPSPGEVASVFRRLGRAFNDGGLDEWAEVHVPGLIARSRAHQDRGKQDPLVGKVLLEDRQEARTPAPVASGTAQPVASSLRPSTGNTQAPWKKVVPKRYRDAAPSRPPLTGTETPAPLRRSARRTPPTDERRAVQSQPEIWPSPPPAERAERPPRRRKPSAASNVLYFGMWLSGLFMLAAGLVVFAVAVWFVGS